MKFPGLTEEDVELTRRQYTHNTTIDATLITTTITEAKGAKVKLLGILN